MPDEESLEAKIEAITMPAQRKYAADEFTPGLSLCPIGAESLKLSNLTQAAR